MKELFLKPELEIIRFNCDDIVTASFDGIDVGEDDSSSPTVDF